MARQTALDARTRAAVQRLLRGYVERGVFPGGCFFASTLAEMDARSGPVRELAVQVEEEWRGLLAATAEAARAARETPPELDPVQLAFELEACLELANYHFTMFDDAAVLERARIAIDGILSRAAGTEPGYRAERGRRKK